MEFHDIDKVSLRLYNIRVTSWFSTKVWGVVMIITFSGHSVISSSNKVKEIVKEQIRNNITDVGLVTCYLGGYGDFDKICARACRELKEEYGDIELVYVTPYISLSQQVKIKEMQSCGLCDTSIYPPIENAPPRFAISKRNEWMMTNADLIIAYVNHSYGGHISHSRWQNAERKK